MQTEDTGHDGSEIGSLLEESCVKCLAGMKSATISECFADITEAQKKLKAWQDILNEPQPSQLSGTKVNFFLSIFVRSTKIHAYEPLVNTNLIQKAIESFSRVSGLNGEPVPVEDAACRSYFNAAVAVGCLQSGDFTGGMKNNFYKRMHESLKRSYGEEKIEVVSAHVLIAFFCDKTCQPHKHLKHIGFARVLLNCLQDQTPDHVKKAFFMVAYSKSLASLLLKTTESEALRLFQLKCSIPPEFFRKAFPHMNAFIEGNMTKKSEADMECSLAIQAIIQVGDVNAMSCLCLGSLRYFQSILTDPNLTKDSTLEALSELKDFFHLAMTAFQVSLEQLPPNCRAYIHHIELFRFLVGGNLQSAKVILATALQSMDIFRLCALLTQSPVLEHQLHFLIVATAVLEMHDDYYAFQAKLNTALSILERPQCFPRSLRNIRTVECDFMCEQPGCQLLWTTLPAHVKCGK